MPETCKPSWRRSRTRLTRNRRDELALIKTCQAKGVIIALVRGSDLDLSTAAGRMVADMMAATARMEIDQKSERQARAELQRAQQGRRSGGRRPFGYEADGMTVREDEALAVKRAYEDLLAGVSLAEIGRQWTAAGLYERAEVLPGRPEGAAEHLGTGHGAEGAPEKP